MHTFAEPKTMQGSTAHYYNIIIFSTVKAGLCYYVSCTVTLKAPQAAMKGPSRESESHFHAVKISVVQNNIGLQS